jgi:hypothetical protein
MGGRETFNAQHSTLNAQGKPASEVLAHGHHARPARKIGVDRYIYWVYASCMAQENAGRENENRGWRAEDVAQGCKGTAREDACPVRGRVRYRKQIRRDAGFRPRDAGATSFCSALPSRRFRLRQGFRLRCATARQGRVENRVSGVTDYGTGPGRRQAGSVKANQSYSKLFKANHVNFFLNLSHR